MTTNHKPATALPIWKQLNKLSHEFGYDSPRAVLLGNAAQLLTKQERAVKALRVLTGLCENVPVFLLDDGKATVKAIRLAGKFTGAMNVSRAVLHELGEAS